ncbi:MAG: tetratricopeptide repeat protein [Planctomycetes bacterium]|nr:tetratricopeptide repeat protein [Planctomycetota bacterium]
MTARAALGLWGLLAVGAVGACRAQVPPPATEPAPTLRERAFAAERAERFAEAADAFLALARAEPRHVDWVVAAGRCLGRCGRLEEAADLLVAARRTFPGSIEVDTTLAKTYLLLAEQPETMAPRVRWAEAAELAAQVLEAAPDDEESRLILAQATYLLGDAARARAEAEEAVRRHPGRSGAHVLLGRIAMDRFAALLRRHAEEQPEGQAAADLVAAIDAERQLATRSFRRAAELAPERAHPHVALAQLALLDRRTAAARAHLLDALAIDPDTPFEHRLFDQELDWQQRRTAYAEALRRYDQGGAALPAKRATLQWYEARALYDGGQWRAARDGFAAALAAKPEATHSHYYLALCHYRLGDLDAATRDAAAYARVGAAAFADVVRGLPGDTRGEVGAIVQFLADRAFRAGDIAASRDLNHVIACLADSADAWNNHAFLCRETGQFEAALASYLHAQEKEPDSPQLLNDTAVVLHYHLPPTPANRAKAAGLYERAIQLADKLLANAQVQGVARDRARQAKADATANLAALAAK